MKSKKINVVSLHEAKTRFSKLVNDAANGEPFIITKWGKPLVKVVSVKSPIRRQLRRLGFLAGQISVPDDFDTMGREVIQELFLSRKI